MKKDTSNLELRVAELEQKGIELRFTVDRVETAIANGHIEEDKGKAEIHKLEAQIDTTWRAYQEVEAQLVEAWDEETQRLLKL